MDKMFNVFLNFIITIFLSVIITPIIKKISFIVGAVDKPSSRRMNKNIMPTMGGLSIYLSSFIVLFLLQPIDKEFLLPVFISSTIIIVTGVLDDIYEIKPIVKVLGILVAALIIYFQTDMSIRFITLPYIGQINISLFSLPITLIWIIGITNSINLIDGLDGLASGISIIALTTLGVLAVFFLGTASLSRIIFIFTVVSATIGLWVYNFYPASIYLGDTGALFLGFIISIVSLQGLKNATVISLLIPIVILGVPITDTFSAIIRRTLNKTPISAADKNHMHHKLLQLGMTHRQAVLFLYLIAMIFSIIALIVPVSSAISVILLIVALLIGIEFLIETIGLISDDHKPLITFITNLMEKVNRNR